MGWRGESHNHGLCAKGIKVRKPKNNFTKNMVVEVRWDGGSKKLSIDEVSRGNIEMAITEDKELRVELIEKEAPFKLYKDKKELII